MLRPSTPMLLLLCLVACGDDAASERGAVPGEVVTTTTVTMQPWHDRIRALRTVKARESVAVTAKVSETVEQVHFDSGDAVEAGAPLGTLSPQQQHAALAADQAAAPEPERRIGSAACREGVCQYGKIEVVAGSLKTKQKLT